MADHTRVVVYVKAEDARSLRAEGKEPSEWVRTLVKRAFDKRRGSK
jgi:tRNA threonylcarbamoyladenosine modification (KEOPS) complex  Pcc1 subunit